MQLRPNGMAKIWSGVLVLVALLPIIGCQPNHLAKGPCRSATGPSLDELKVKTLAGDRKASDCLYSRYFESLPTADRTKWVGIAAKAGSVGAILEIANVRWGRGGADNCAAAINLVERAIQVSEDERERKDSRIWLHQFQDDPCPARRK
jgi:hypothetical protein